MARPRLRGSDLATALAGLVDEASRARTSLPTPGRPGSYCPLAVFFGGYDSPMALHRAEPTALMASYLRA